VGVFRCSVPSKARSAYKLMHQLSCAGGGYLGANLSASVLGAFLFHPVRRLFFESPVPDVTITSPRLHALHRQGFPFFGLNLTPQGPRNAFLAMIRLIRTVAPFSIFAEVFTTTSHRLMILWFSFSQKVYSFRSVS